MKRNRTRRAIRIVLPPAAADYGEAFTITVSTAERPEQWARRMFGDAPAAVRTLLVVGWRFGLGLHLQPASSTGQVLGWQVTESTADTVVLKAESRLLCAQKIVRVDGSQLTVTTLVHFERALGRRLWHAVVPIHRLIEPYLLARAAGRPQRPAV